MINSAVKIVPSPSKDRTLDQKTLLSLVIPVYNEEEVLESLFRRLQDVANDLPVSVECVLVDDGSSDRSLELMEKFTEQDERFRIVVLSRNFGHQSAVYTGLSIALGDVVARNGDAEQEVVAEGVRLRPQLRAEGRAAGNVVEAAGEVGDVADGEAAEKLPTLQLHPVAGTEPFGRFRVCHGPRLSSKTPAARRRLPFNIRGRRRLLRHAVGVACVGVTL